MARRHAWLVASWVLIISSCGGLFAEAQGGAQPAANPWATLLPGLRTAPAPNWIRPGTRITYRGSSAVITGTRYYYQDPDGKWVDQHGKTYSEIPSPGPAGLGFAQITVLAMEPTVAVLAWRTFILQGVSGPASPTPNDTGSFEFPGAGGDIWLNPQVLRGLATMATPTVQLAPVRYTINARHYNALWIHTRQPKANLTYVFDLDSGIQLHTSSAAQGPPPQGVIVPRGQPNEGSTVLSQNTLADVRTPGVPWALEPAPEWVDRVSMLRYQGAMSHRTPVAGMPNPSLPFTLTFRRQRTGSNWAQYVQTIEQGGAAGVSAPPSQTIRFYGSQQFGGLWVPPHGFAQIRPGQVLDSDPVTKVKVLVGQMGRSPQGADVVVITETNEAYRADSVYDRSTGMLVAATIIDHTLSNETHVQLVQRQ